MFSGGHNLTMWKVTQHSMIHPLPWAILKAIQLTFIPAIGLLPDGMDNEVQKKWNYKKYFQKHFLQKWKEKKLFLVSLD